MQFSRSKKRKTFQMFLIGLVLFQSNFALSRSITIKTDHYPAMNMSSCIKSNYYTFHLKKTDEKGDHFKGYQKGAHKYWFRYYISGDNIVFYNSNPVNTCVCKWAQYVGPFSAPACKWTSNGTQG